MRCVIDIKRNEDGAMARYQDDAFYQFMWEEGNYSCDCNRELFFLRARGEDDGVEETECSKGRYSVRVYCYWTCDCLYDEIGD